MPRKPTHHADDRQVARYRTERRRRRIRKALRELDVAGPSGITALFEAMRNLCTPKAGRRRLFADQWFYRGKNAP